ncbi:TRAP transporter large permease [Nocardioides sp. 616]|uniref:TRAP transporter large permease n=1 Tax=Nocardioides sp. 616 TaxID=2268090 RepID=UPI000CE536B0|nr:TRAP transporter large permease [Nocardioides sp. 616]
MTDLITPVGAEPASDAPTGASERRGWLILAALLVSVLVPAAGMFADVEREIVGLLAIVMMLGLIFIKAPVAVALMVPGLLGTLALRGFPAMKSGLTDLPYNSTATWTLSVIPMFVLMGLLLWQSGITTRVYDTGRDWLGWLPGGLAIGTNFAGAGLSAVSGSSIATTYALARVGVPEMIRAGYDKRLAILAVAVSGLPGQLIPPSIMLVIYAGIAEVPVGPQLMAGVGPGVLVALVFAVVIAGMSMVFPRLTNVTGDVAAKPRTTWADRWRSLGGAWSIPVLIGIIIGGIYSGTLTVTEAGAVAALVAMLLTLFYKRNDKPFAAIGQASVSTVASTGAIFFLIIGATMFSRMLTLSGVTRGIGEWIIDMELPSWQFLLLMTLIYLIMGMFLDPLAMMLLTVPILIPTLEILDISLLWFGVFVVFMGELAVLTPPVGILAYIIHNITKDPAVNRGTDISLRDVFVAIAWMMPASILIVVILIVFPEIATYIPDHTGG